MSPGGAIIVYIWDELFGGEASLSRNDRGRQRRQVFASDLFRIFRHLF